MLSEPNVGAPDGVFREVGCGMAIIVDLGAGSPITTTHPGYDLVYYERADVATPGNISLDRVALSVCSDPGCVFGSEFPVFNWGDNIVDANTSLSGTSYSGPPELDNALIPMTNPPLYGWPSPFTSGTIVGIAIDVDAVLPHGECSTPPYCQWVKIYSPLGSGNDGAEVDALYVIP
jgi:hypothetical protein